MAHTASLGLRAELADLWATALGQPGPRAWRSRQGAAPRASRHPVGTLRPRRSSPAARWNEALGEYILVGTRVCGWWDPALSASAEGTPPPLV